MTWLLTSRRRAVVGEPAEERPEVAAQHRVEPDRRLVEHQQLGRTQQRGAERHPGELAAGEPVDAGVRVVGQRRPGRDRGDLAVAAARATPSTVAK